MRGRRRGPGTEAGRRVHQHSVRVDVMRRGRSGRELSSSDAAAHDFAAAHTHADNTWSFAGALAGAHAPALGTNTPGRSRADAEADGADASTNNCTDAEADIYDSTDRLPPAYALADNTWPYAHADSIADAAPHAPAADA